MVGAVSFCPQVEPPPPPALRITQDVRTGELFRIFLTTLVLTVLTLGFYRYWGRTNLRRYLWSHVSMLGDRAATFHGRGERSEEHTSELQSP